jgi:amidase
MALRIPTRDDLHRLAQRHYFTLSHDEGAAYHTVLTGIFPLLEHSTPCRSRTRHLSIPNATPGVGPSASMIPTVPSWGAARSWERPKAPLAGKRIGLKDNVSIAGIPMTYGSNVLQGLVPDTNATIVTRLLDAGPGLGRAQHGQFCLLRRRRYQRLRAHPQSS